MVKNKGLQFLPQGSHHGRLLKNFMRAVATNPEEVAVDTDPNIDWHALSYNHEKFGVFVHSV